MRKTILLLSITGIVNFFTNIIIAINIYDGYSIVNNYLSDLAVGLPGILFNFAIITVTICLIPFFILYYQAISNNKNRKYFKMALALLIFAIPFIGGLLIFKTMEYPFIHDMFTYTFYGFAMVSVLFWVLGLFNIHPSSQYVRKWIFVEHYLSLLLVIGVGIIHFFDPSYDPILQKVTIFGFLLIVLYISLKMWFIETRTKIKTQNIEYLNN